MIRTATSCFALLAMLFSVACGAKPHLAHTLKVEGQREQAQLGEGDHLALPTPALDVQYAQGVSGHSAGVVRLEGEASPIIWMVGGCNFPEVSAADGGKKRFYSDIYTGQLVEDSIRWRLVGRLPHALAYAATLTTPTGALISGGQDGAGTRSEVYMLEVISPDSVAVRLHSRLPEGRSGASLVAHRGAYYLIGGSSAKGLTAEVYRYPTEGKGANSWEAVSAYPSPTLLKILAWATPSYIYMLGSIAHSEQEAVLSEAMLSLMRYDADKDEWQDTGGFPKEMRDLGVTLGGGALCQVNECSVLFIGGVHLDKFLPAIQRGQRLRLASWQGDTVEVERLKRKSREYLLHPEAWYKFSPHAWLWQEDPDVSEGRWTKFPMSLPPRADAVLAEYAPNMHLLIGGELKPGIRSSQLYLLPHLTDLESEE